MAAVPRSPLVVAVVGSPRPHGNTATLVDAALTALGARGAACEAIMLGAKRVQPCRGHETCGDVASCPLDDDAAAVLDRVYAADALILATPVYYENVSAQMKAFIDRNVFRYSHDEWLRAKVVGLIAVTAETGLDDALAALGRYVSLSTDGDVPVFSCGGFADGLGAAAGDEKLLGEVRRLAADIAEELGLSQAGSHGSR